MTQCRKCGHIRSATDQGPEYACPACKAVYAKVSAALAPVDHARATGDWSGISQQEIDQLAAKVIVSTLEHLPGYSITENLEILSADFAYAFGGIFEAVAGLARNIGGSGNSWMTTDFMLRGRQATTTAIRRTAVQHRADAVIGVRYHFQEFSGANQRGVLVVAATGTAVKIKKI